MAHFLMLYLSATNTQETFLVWFDKRFELLLNWWKETEIEPSFRSRGVGGSCGFASDAAGRSRERKGTFLVLSLSGLFWVIQTRKRRGVWFLRERRVEISSLSEDDGVTSWFEGENRARVGWNVAGEDGGCGGCWWADGWAASDYGVEIPIVGHLTWFLRGDKKSFLLRISEERRWKQRRQKRALTFFEGRGRCL